MTTARSESDACFLAELQDLLLRYSYNVDDADALLAEGMGPGELAQRLTEVSGLERTHNLKKVEKHWRISRITCGPRKKLRGTGGPRTHSPSHSGTWERYVSDLEAASDGPWPPEVLSARARRWRSMG